MQVSDSGRRQGSFKLAQSIMATHGIRGLYKGGVPHLFIAPFTSFYYVIYEELLFQGKHLTADEKLAPDGHPLLPLGAAVCARTVEVTARMPLELIRTMMQTADASVTLSSCIKSQLKQPLPSWFQGYVPTLLRDVPFSAVYWLGYEKAKSRVSIPEDIVARESLRTLLQSFVCGAGAGMLAAILIAPLDVIKTVRQHHALIGAKSTYANILKTIRDNPVVAFAGIGPRLVRIPSGLATMMATLELTKWTFARSHAEIGRAHV